MPTQYLFSAWYRNGEDIIFYEPEFHALAYQIAMGEHQYEFSISNLGWHLHFFTPTQELEVLLESWWIGSGKITIKTSY